MKILSIETSCDETAITILEAEGTTADATFTVLGNALYSQVEKHAVFGGVYPSLAKREHAENLVPLLVRALSDAGLHSKDEDMRITETQQQFIEHVLVREGRLAHHILQDLSGCAWPEIDMIAVTHGPGLEPALWVGVNFARVLAYLWSIPIMPVNHLEGHLVASAVRAVPSSTPAQYQLETIKFPALGLILSGGHTEFVLSQAWGTYTKIGATRDDSVGEAYDKVARILGLPYPGGPEISRIAEKGRPSLQKREVGIANTKPLPSPMLHSEDLDFSFSGLKTAVKYAVRDLGDLTDEMRQYIAADFERAVISVILAKTKRAVETHAPRTLLLGGGVANDAYIRSCLTHYFTQSTDAELRLPAPGLSTDNAVMIGMVGYLAHLRNDRVYLANEELTANGNLSWV